MWLLRVLLVISSITACITQNSYVTLTVTNSGPPLTNFQLKFTLNAFGTLSGNFNRMRVYVEGQQTPVPQWIEDPTAVTTAVVWVKIPNVVNNMILTVTDGNSISSNPDDVFELFDNFDGTALNSSKWVIGANQYTKNGRTAISTRISANCNAGIAGAAVANQGLIQTINSFADFYIEFGFYVYGATGCCSCPLASFKLKGGCYTNVESYHMRFDTGHYAYGTITDGNYNALASGKAGRTLTPIASYGQNYNVDTEVVMDGDRFLPAVFYEVRIQLIGKQVTHYLKGALTGNVWELQNTYGSSSQSFSTPSQPISFLTQWGGILILDYIRLSKASTQSTSVSAQSATTVLCAAGTYLNMVCTTTISTLQRSCGASGTDVCSAEQSSREDPIFFPAADALDQNVGTFTHTATQTSPWWRLDFGRSVIVTKVIVYNRNNCCPERLANFKITVGDSSSVDVNAVCASNIPAPMVSPFMADVTCVTPLRGQYLHISLPGTARTLHFAELQVTGCEGMGCSACPVGTTSPSGSTSVSNCTCSPGYVNISDVCTAVITRAVRISGTLTSVTTDSSPGEIAVAMSQFRYQIAAKLGIPVGLVQIERTYLSSGRALLSTEITIVITISARSTMELSTLVAATTDLSTIAGLSGASQTIVEGTTQLSLTCSACPADTYYTGGVCSSCTGNTTSVTGSTGCQCKAGFTNTSSGCQACPAGTYKRLAGTSACRSCQANSVSQSGSALCACGPGYTGNNGDVCIACVSGKYKNVTGSAACIDCAAMRNSPAAAPNVTSCVCNVGYTQVENAALTFDVVYARACVACEAGKFKALTGVQACTTCPQNQSSVTAMTICSCVAGFTGPDGGPCAECARGTYKDWLGPQSCTGCPAQTNTAGTGSALLSNCRCNMGYTGPDGVACVQCVAGTYKNVTGSATCSTCPSRTMSSMASTSIERCQCMPSFMGPDGGPCVQCPSGQYKNWPNSSCAQCSANSASTEGSTLCKCDTGTTEVLGYRGITADNFEKYDLLQTCGASGQEMCKSLGCGANARVWHPDSTDKFQDNDFTTGGGIPANWDCRPGGWSMSALPIDFGREIIVTSVVVYFELGWCGNHFCGPAYTVRVGNTLPGWSPDINNELLCPASTPSYSSSPRVWMAGQTFVKFTIDCGSTLRGRYFTINKENVQWSSAVMTAWEMQVMGYKESMTCASCAAGKYKSNNGTAPCTTCPANSYEPDVGATLVTNCSCNAGFEGVDGGPCVACVPGKYKDTNGTAPCVTCPADTYIDVHGSAYCKSCPPLTTSVNGSPAVTACRCVPGYTGSGGGATVLVYSSNLARTCGTNSNQACLSAASTTRGGTTSNALDNDVNTLFITEAGGDQWFKIDFGKVVNVQSFTIVVVYSWEVDYQRNIKVRVGNVDSYSSLLNPTCYEHVGSLITLGAGVPGWTRTISCTTPREGQYLFYVNPTGLNYIEFGEFSVQGFLPAAGIPCSACVRGKYKPSIGDSECTLCGVRTYSEAVNATSVETCLECQGNSTSIAGSPSKMFCQCNVGFLHEGEECAMCSPGTYNSELGRTACSTCSIGLYSVNYQATSNETCLPCPAGKWSPEGSPVCMDCPANSAAPPRMGRIVDCACNVGYTGPGGGPCVQCEVGKYKNTTGYWPCSTCPAYSSSGLASVKITDCFCNIGFYGVNGLPCTGCVPGKYNAVPGKPVCELCPVNTYSDRVGVSVCTPCVSTSFSANGSTSIWNCTCNAGYTGPTYQGVQSNTNFARSCGNGSQACPTTQSSNFMSFTADLAVDGTTLTRSNTMFASSQWWRVDFGRRVTITSVAIFFSQHSIDTLVIHVGDGQSALENNICSSVNFYGTADDWKTVNCSTATTGRYLHVRNTVGSIVGFREIQPVGSEIVTMVWPGYCESCKAGFFKTTTGNQVCSPCPANTFSNVTTAIFAETCIPCASNAVSGSGSTFCQCDVGFTSEAGSCVACPFGKFKGVVGSSACNVCSPNSVGLENTRETCACVAGYELSWSNV